MVLPKKRIVAVGACLALASGLTGCAGRHNLCRECEPISSVAGLYGVAVGPEAIEPPRFVAGPVAARAMTEKSIVRERTLEELNDLYAALSGRVHTLENRVDDVAGYMEKAGIKPKQESASQTK